MIKKLETFPLNRWCRLIFRVQGVWNYLFQEKIQGMPCWTRKRYRNWSGPGPDFLQLILYPFQKSFQYKFTNWEWKEGNHGNQLLVKRRKWLEIRTPWAGLMPIIIGEKKKKHVLIVYLADNWTMPAFYRFL